MKKQAFNPYLPSYEYIPDGEPYVFDGRVYIYGSHDRFDGPRYCANDYVCWSAPVDDLGNWRYEGVIYRKDQDPMNPDGSHCLYAPDVQQGPDGRYYLYYALDNLSAISVAVCDTPAGAYAFYGTVHDANGRIVGQSDGDIFQFDPGVLVDDDGRIYLYSGFAPADTTDGLRKQTRLQEGGYFFELAQDMVTILRGPILLFPKVGYAQGTGYEGHEFFEASSLRKVGDKYYFVYSSINGHELCYAVSDRPDGGFVYGGTLVSNGDVYLDGRSLDDALNYTGNTHGSIVEINGAWYVFYHRQTNLHQYSRQACAERIVFEADGTICQVEMTSCGLHNGPLAGLGEYEARIACNLRSREGAVPYIYNKKLAPGIHPYFTQDGADREADGDQHIANFQQGALAGFKYFQLGEAAQITVKVRGVAKGTVVVSTAMGAPPVAKVEIAPSAAWQSFSAPFCAEAGVYPLYFTFDGDGAFDFLSFTLA